MRSCSVRPKREGCGGSVPDGVDVCPHCGRELERLQLLAALDEPIGPYVPTRVIGSGFSGAVYLARSVMLPHGPEVVLKETALLPGVVGHHHTFRQLEQLNDPSLPLLIDMFELDGFGYLVMECIDAPRLSDLLKQQQGPLFEKTVRSYAIQLLSLLDRLHTLQPPLIHGDITPHNLRVTNGGTVKLVDLSLFGPGDDAHERPFLLSGVYWAPEYQRRGRPDPRSDLYSVAATLYEALTAVRPQPAVTRLTFDSLVAPNRLRESLSPALNLAILRGLSLNPDDRWPTAAAFRDAASGARSTSTIEYGADPLPRPLPPTDTVTVARPVERAPQHPPRRRNRWLLPLAIGLTALALVAWWRLSHSAPRADGQLILAEDFSDGAQVQLQIDDSDGCSVSNGALQCRLPAGDPFSIRMPTVTDAMPSAGTVLLTIRHAADGANLYGGFYLRAPREGQEPYMLLVSRNGNYVVTDRTSVTGLNEAEHPALNGRTNRLRLEFQAGRLSFFANDQLLTTIDDPQFTASGLSLAMLNVDPNRPGSLSFDDLVVSAAGKSAQLNAADQ